MPVKQLSSGQLLFCIACLFFSPQTILAQTNSNWTNGSGGNWSEAGSWSTGNFPNNDGANLFNATIDLSTGTEYVVTQDDSIEIEMLTLNSADAILQLTGTIQTNQGFEILAGQVRSAGATIKDSDVNIAGGSLTFTTGISNVDNSTINNGFFRVDSGSRVNFNNNGTFTNHASIAGQIFIDGNDQGSSQRTFDSNQLMFLSNGFLNATSGTNLVFGSTNTVRGLGSIFGSNEIVNEGLILANVQSNRLNVLSLDRFTNRGTMRSENGGRLVLEGVTYNESIIEAINNAAITIEDDLINSGTMRLTDSRAIFVSDVQFENLGVIEQSGNSEVLITGSMDLEGQAITLANNQTGDLTIGATGRISNGIINQGDASLLFFEETGATTQGVLDNVVLNGGLRITQKDASVRLENGTKFNGDSEVSGQNSKLEFVGTEGNASATAYRFDSNSEFDVVRSVQLTGNVRFEIGPDATLKGVGTIEGNPNSAIINEGLVTGGLQINGGRLENRGAITTNGNDQMRIRSEFINEGTVLAADDSEFNVRGRFTNSGSFAASGNGEVILDNVVDELGTLQTTGNGKILIAGTWDLTGKSVVLDDPNLNLQVGGTILGGTIKHQNGGGLKFEQVRMTVLDGTTIEGDVSISGTNATMTFQNGASVAPGGMISLGELSKIQFDGSTDGSLQTYELAGLSINLEKNSRIGLLGNIELTIEEDTSIRGVGIIHSQVRNLNPGGRYINLGTITADGPGTLTIDGNEFQNNGILAVEEGSHLLHTADLVVSNGTTRVDGRLSGFDFIENGILEGNGRVESDLVLNGMLSPGVDGIGELLFTKLQLNEAAEWMIDIGGTEFGEIDLLSSTQTIALDGSLSVNFVNDFSLAEGESFLFADISGTRTGQFAGLAEGDIVATQNNFRLRLSYMAGDGDDLGFFTTAVPEPSTLGILAGLAICVLVKRRRFGLAA